MSDSTSSTSSSHPAFRWGGRVAAFFIAVVAVTQIYDWFTTPKGPQIEAVMQVYPYESAPFIKDEDPEDADSAKEPIDEVVADTLKEVERQFQSAIDRMRQPNYSSYSTIEIKNNGKFTLYDAKLRLGDAGVATIRRSGEETTTLRFNDVIDLGEIQVQDSILLNLWLRLSVGPREPVLSHRSGYQQVLSDEDAEGYIEWKTIAGFYRDVANAFIAVAPLVVLFLLFIFLVYYLEHFATIKRHSRLDSEEDEQDEESEPG